eukprot:TRINITY_DN14659_c0_g1_i1.p1 TRINITY_DN14659_c0_g1~~TRINITY_DN14659_c0_g1_i1.p1  ORF type:complete len:146 (+),score=20.80 TRINITY_DN14659_c0_g1_i1:173-610(+)
MGIYNAFITRFAFCMFKKLKYSLFLILIVHCLRFIANIPVVLYSIVYIKKPLDDSLIFIFLNILFLSVSQYFLWVIIQRPENELPKKKLIRSQNNNPVNLSLIHISEPTRPLYISYAVFCLKKKKQNQHATPHKHTLSTLHSESH